MKEKWLYAVVNLLPKGMFRTLSKLYDKALAKIVIEWKHFNHFCTNASPKMFDTDPKNVLGLCSAAIMKIIEKSYSTGFFQYQNMHCGFFWQSYMLTKREHVSSTNVFRENFPKASE